MSRSLAFVVVRLVELVICTFGCLAPFICAPVLMALEPVSDGLRPPAPVDPATDLREAYPAQLRTCHDCKGPIPAAEGAVQAEIENAWMHFECWYDGAPFKRDPVTGERVGL